jgi:hypothetical protein
VFVEEGLLAQALARAAQQQRRRRCFPCRNALCVERVRRKHRPDGVARLRSMTSAPAI